MSTCTRFYTCGDEQSLSRLHGTFVALLDHVTKEHLALPCRRHPLLILTEVFFGWFNKVEHFLSLEVKGAMSGIFSETLKSQKTHLHHWKPKINGPPRLVKITISVKKLPTDTRFCLQIAKMEMEYNLKN